LEAELTRSVRFDSNYSDWTKTQLIERLQELQRREDELNRAGRSRSSEIEAWKQTDNLLGPLTDALPVLISYVDTEQRYLFCNKAYEVWFEYPRESLYGRHVREVVGDAAYEVIGKYLERALTGETAIYEGTVPYATGGVRNTHAYYVPDFDENGIVKGMFVSITDITELKNTEKALQKLRGELESLVEDRTLELVAANEALRKEAVERERLSTELLEREAKLHESHAQLRLVTDSMPAHVAYVDANHRVQFANKPFAESFGYSQDNIVGEFLEKVLGPGLYAKNLNAIERVLSGIPVVDEVEFEISDGQKCLWRAIRVPHFDDDGHIQGYFTIILDVTEDRAREEQLRQAQKMEAVGQLTGGIAHDFNNILTAIVGNLDLASDHAGPNSEIGSLIDRANDAAWRGATLTDRLLTYSRKQALLPQVTDASELVKGMTDLLRRTLVESIDIEFVGAGKDLWRCKADPSQLENAILNLAINARDAMPGGGKLTIETDNAGPDDDYAAAQADVAPGEYVMVAVTDTGTGMAAEVIQQVFEPFFTTKEVGVGSGLGLSMVYGFVKQSGGHVTVYSEVGVGTTVKLFLPRTEALAGELEHGDQIEAPEAHGETILVVEDDPDVRTLSVALLSNLGYEVMEAANGPAALSMLEKSSRVNLLFTDVVLPGGMNGPELAAEVARRRPGIGILYTSGYTEEAIIHQGGLDEGIELLPKPFRREDLAQKIRSAIDRSHT
jgi:PAS domain S-box-containing protein